MTAVARVNDEQAVHTIRKNFYWYNGSSISMGASIPARSVVLGFDVAIVTAFNAGTTNVLTVGKTGTLDYFVDTGDLDEFTTGITTDILTGSGYTATEIEPLISFTQTGTAATAGQAIVICKYVPDRDL